MAKAIRDGAIDAMLDHDAGAMVSRASQDVYVSGEPSEAFHARVAFCLDLHNEAVKAMRFEVSLRFERGTLRPDVRRATVVVSFSLSLR